MLTMVVQILEFVIVLGLLAFLHEFGHFIASKLFKIEVEEFGFGFPPRLAKLFTFSGTDITLNWIPFGAFVRPKGENDPEVPGGLAAANPWKRLVVLLAGPIMNLITGIILFSLVFNRTGVPDTKTVLIADVSKNSPAANAGLLPGDIINKINGTPINSMGTLTSLVQQNLGKEISLGFERDKQEHSITATPRVNPPTGEGALGIVMSNPVVQVSWLQALPFAAYVTYDYGHQLLLMPAHLLQGTIQPAQARMVGPKGIYDMFSQMQARDQQAKAQKEPPSQSSNTLTLVAIISVALGLTNLLPIPALDGGRILFVLPEIIIRKRVPARYENLVHTIGFMLLISLLVYITIQDFVNPIVVP
jgi:regulator of sigma E protease